MNKEILKAVTSKEFITAFVDIWNEVHKREKERVMRSLFTPKEIANFKKNKYEKGLHKR